MDQRVVKVPLPVDLIRQMDEAIVNGRGGLSTRAELVREAVESFLAEINFPAAPPEPSPGPGSGHSEADAAKETPVRSNTDATSASVPPDVLEAVPAWELEELRLSDLAGTALTVGAQGAVLESGVAKAAEGPLLGLHNRDYPSLWAAHRLARYTGDELLPFREFRDRATNAAWVYAAELERLETGGEGLRLRAMFPSNPRKRDSAERGFQTFAIGTVPRRTSDEGPLDVAGPLFAWQLCQLTNEDGELLIGLTGIGWRLLEKLSGIDLQLPHNPDDARMFLGHLAETAPDDRWGFDQILVAAADQPTRQDLVSLIERKRAEWTPATASSIAQGYVARAREWGLVEPRLIEGRYRLTTFGNEYLEQVPAQATTDNDGHKNQEGNRND